MQNDHLRLVLNDEPDSKDVWRHGSASALRLKGDFTRGKQARSCADIWALGRLDILEGHFANLSLEPIADGGEPWLFLKLVTRGAMNVEQGDQTRRVGPGEMVLIESTRPYRQAFDEPTSMTALRFPASALKERGLRYNLRGPILPDMSSADTRAIGELVVSIAGQCGATSADLRRRQGDHFLDLIDVLIDDSTALSRTRSSDATLFRAKRFIAQNLRNPDLTAPEIALAVRVSDTHLSRLFRAEGRSLMRYVWDSRLRLAADMLRRSDKGSVQIAEIAYRCGFSTPAHFSRSFRGHYGMSPREALRATDSREGSA
jgi:AraC-like DNA-binding protein